MVYDERHLHGHTPRGRRGDAPDRGVGTKTALLARILFKSTFTYTFNIGNIRTPMPDLACPVCRRKRERESVCVCVKERERECVCVRERERVN